ATHHRDETLGVAVDVVHMVGKGVPYLLLERVATRWTALVGGQLVGDDSHDREVQAALVREMVRDQPRGDPRGLRDVGGGHLLVGLAHEQFARRRDQHLATAPNRPRTTL